MGTPEMQVYGQPLVFNGSSYPGIAPPYYSEGVGQFNGRGYVVPPSLPIGHSFFSEAANSIGVYPSSISTFTVKETLSIQKIVEGINEGLHDENYEILVQQAARYLEELEAKAKEEKNIPWILDKLLGLAAIEASANQELKLQALNLLVDLLRKDDFTHSKQAQGLVKLALGLMEKLKGESIQTEQPEVQMKIAVACGLAIENILRHYEFGHLNAVLDTFQKTLVDVCKTLSDLNTTNTPGVDFAVEYTLEGAKRLQTNANKLLETLKRIGSAFKALSSFYEKDIAGGLESLFKAVEGLDQEVKFPWYASVYFFGKWMPLAKKDPQQLERMHRVYEESFKKLMKPDWKGTYHYIDILFLIAKEGNTSPIRQRAITFLSKIAECKQFPKEYNIGRTVQQFRKFKAADVNIAIRQHAVERLLEISEKSEDGEEVKMVRTTLVAIRAAEERENHYLISLTSTEKNKSQSGLVTFFSKKKEEVFLPTPQSEQQRFVDFLATAVPKEKEVWIAEGPNVKDLKNPHSTVSLHTRIQGVQTAMIPSAPGVMIEKKEEVALIAKPKPHAIYVTLAKAFGVNPDWLAYSGLLLSGMALGEKADTVRLYNNSLYETLLPFIKGHSEEIQGLNLCYIEDSATTITDDTAAPLAELLRDHPALDLVLSTPHAYSAVGLALEKVGQFDLAVHYYTKGIALAPEDPKVSRLYARRSGAYLEGLQEKEKALADAEKGWKMSSQQCQYSGYALMDAYDSFKQFAKSVEIAYVMHRLDHNEPMNIYNLAARICNCPASLQELEYAGQLYRQYLVLNPLDPDTTRALQRLPSKIEYWRKSGIK